MAYKRYLEGNKDAGKVGHPPFPVVYDPVVSLLGMRAFGASRNLTTVLEVGSNVYISGVFRQAAPVAQATLNAVAALSRGRLTATHNNLAIVCEKPAGDTAGAAKI